MIVWIHSLTLSQEKRQAFSKPHRPVTRTFYEATKIHRVHVQASQCLLKAEPRQQCRQMVQACDVTPWIFLAELWAYLDTPG